MPFLDQSRKLFLAPMSGITDTSVRRLYRSLGAEVVVTELISAESIVNGHKKTAAMLNFDSSEHPIGIQLFGGDPVTLNLAAKIVESYKPDFIDLNLGCPMRKVTKKSCGSALLRDPKFLEELLFKMIDGVKTPVAIKIRTGWTEDTKNALENIFSAKKANVEFVSIHGRTREQGYSGYSDWQYIKEVTANSPLPIIGNGDLNDADSALQRWQETNCYGIMIGRGALINPFIFLEIKNKLNLPTSKNNILNIIDNYITISEETLNPKIKNIKRAKLFDWFAMRYNNYSEFRKKIYTLKAEESHLIEFAKEFFSKEKVSLEFKAQNFLMGGHG